MDNIELNDLDVNQERLKTNMTSLRNIRVYGALNAGILSGIFGFDGLIGISIYLFVFLIVSCCLAIKMKFQVTQYFKSKYDALYGGIATDLMLFLMVWVVFHNLVNIL